MSTFAKRLFLVAAHPDDDVIGCGGATMQVVNGGGAVCVAILSNGGRSHPKSRRFSEETIAALRAEEAHAALVELGVTTPPLLFGFPDGELSALAPADAEQLTRQLAAAVEHFMPDVVLDPWPRDPHPDHIAASAFTSEAIRRARYKGALGFYEVWLPIRGKPADLPRDDEASISYLSLDENARARKRRALYAHRTQTTLLIDDDPDGFHISDTLADRWAGPTERFFWPTP